MRNLKKLLALVLAMVMAFSLMLTANAANPVKNFDDAANITEEFVEAADVLTGMKVFQGDEEAATFRPGDTINRAEVAALIYRLATGDVNDVRSGTYANYGNFADVSESDWFAGYVGYCANAGYIKGHDGYFNPYDSVTGYETLAMILRAIGYDKNHEFEGPTWETNVSALATQLGILTNIKTTHYGNTLYLASRRDVVAELLFQADAKVPMVVYTPAFGYQQTGMRGGMLGEEKNPTLGFHIFGLTSDTGVVVGNQETGESVSRMSFSALPYGQLVYSYLQAMTDGTDWLQYTGAVLDADNGERLINTIATFNWDSGLDLFAHKVNIWFDGRGSSWDPEAGAINNNKLTTYATFDRTTLTATVKVTGDHTNKYVVNADPTGGTTGSNLYSLAKGKGFNVSADTEVYENQGFERFDFGTTGGNGEGRVDTFTAADASPEYLYQLISNSDDKALDVVIALNIQTAEITGEDNVNKIKTVTVPITAEGQPTDANGYGQTDGSSTWKFIADDNELNTADFVLEQDQLVAGSVKTLGKYEIGVHIIGTGADRNTPSLPASNLLTGAGTPGYVPDRTTGGGSFDTNWFKLIEVTEKRQGKVIDYNVDSGDVTLDDGTVLKQSLIYNTVVADTIPHQNSYSNITYEFYLDPAGNYLGAKPVYGSSFVYGTYTDYSQELNTSTFKYFLTGVNLNGEKVTVPVVSKDSPSVKLNATSDLEVPFRDATAAGNGATNGIGDGIYKGWVINNDNARDDIYNQLGVNLADTSGSHGAGVFDQTPTAKYGATTVAGDVLIGRDEITLGAVLASSDYDTNGTDMYFTENTKFIVVSGYGTDSLKASVYDGISALRGDNSTYVNLNMGYHVDNKTTQTETNPVRLAHITDGTSMAEMTYFTTSPFVYAQTGTASRQAEVVILPEAAITRGGASNLYFVGNNNSTLFNADGEDATRFAMYHDGEPVNVWVEGLSTDNVNQPDAYTIKNGKSDVFYRLTPTNKTANDGSTIYEIVNGVPVGSDATASSGVITISEYSASTYSAQTGTFDQTPGRSVADGGAGGTALTTPMRNVANAKIVNVNATRSSNITWPGITDLTTLNYAGSLKDLGYGGEDTLYVCAVVNEDNPLIIDVIYVCYNQSTPT